MSRAAWAAAAVALVGAGAAAWIWIRRRGEAMDVPTSEDPTSPGGPPEPRTDDVEALARMMTSEANNDRAEQIAIGWTAMNRSATRGKPVRQIIAPRGEFGEQGTGGREFSTAKPYSADMFDLAREMLSGRHPDPTGGAEYFDHPAAQRALVRRRPDLYKRTPEDVAVSRRRSGLELVLLPGVPEERFRMWRRA